jgi:hypothetical protein
MQIGTLCPRRIANGLKIRISGLGIAARGEELCRRDVVPALGRARKDVPGTVQIYQFRSLGSADTKRKGIRRESRETTRDGARLRALRSLCSLSVTDLLQHY